MHLSVLHISGQSPNFVTEIDICAGEGEQEVIKKTECQEYKN